MINIILYMGAVGFFSFFLLFLARKTLFFGPMPSYTETVRKRGWRRPIIRLVKDPDPIAEIAIVSMGLFALAAAIASIARYFS